MYSNNRRKSGRKCVLDTEISPALEKKVRARIVKDRRDLRRLIDEHVSKKRDIENRFKLDPTCLSDEALRERIRVLERARANLLGLISTRGEAYGDFLKETNDIRRSRVRQEVESENRHCLENENNILIEGYRGFYSKVKDLVETIHLYKEDYEQRNKASSTDS
ncbi:hypothetical protein OIY81_1869 [Cryptosporidium canis]|nr:hypothetical protein OIY81_1869 [Cryptosporidium canis]